MGVEFLYAVALCFPMKFKARLTAKCWFQSYRNRNTLKSLPSRLSALHTYANEHRFDFIPRESFIEAAIDSIQFHCLALIWFTSSASMIGSKFCCSTFVLGVKGYPWRNQSNWAVYGEGWMDTDWWSLHRLTDCFFYQRIAVFMHWSRQTSYLFQYSWCTILTFSTKISMKRSQYKEAMLQLMLQVT